MKNILFKMLPMVAAVLLATSCSKDDGGDIPAAPDNNNPSSVTVPETNDPMQTVVDGEVPSIPFTITVSKGEDEGLSKAHILGIMQYFDKDDKLQISVENTDIKGTLDLTSAPDKTTGTFSGSLYGNDLVTITDKTLFDVVLTNETYGNEGKAMTTAVQFSDVYEASRQCGFWETHFEYGNTSSIELNQLTAFLIVENVEKVYVKVPGASDYAELSVGSGVIAVPDATWVYTSSPSFGKDNAKKVDVWSTTYDASNNKHLALYHIRRYPNDALRDLYSVSPTTKVFFSKGNLQFTRGESDVKFAENQWDLGYQGKTTGYDVGYRHSKMETGSTIDLFGWGLWTFLQGNTVVSAQFTSSDDDDFKWHTTDPHEIVKVNGGDWFTLTSEEWDYLLNEREGVRFVKANLHIDDATSVKGLIIFPDNFAMSAERVMLNFTNTEVGMVNSTTADFHDISMSGFNDFNVWAADYPVFLPVTGYRDDQILTKNDVGYYWASDMDISEGKPRMLVISSFLANVNKNGNDPHIGYAVRLVHSRFE